MESEKYNRRSIGQEGEEFACRMLEERGHIILERNWRSGHLEIDIISHDAVGIHFVEVKTRQHSIQAPPQDNVDKAKQRRTASAAKAYLKSRPGLPFRNHECIFDVVAITFRGERAEAEYIEQAFIPLYI